ncbi:serine/threonine-protein kinase dst1-like, partial [Trifolium medium]|nr:serine/threonine-protein kinase dst1-like [Trifolium medium]
MNRVGDFGTMIVHRDELFKTTQDTDSTSYKTAFTSGTGSRLSDPG